MNITKIAVAFALLLITGCTHDPERPLEQRATISLKVASGSFATTSPDDQMDNVRIVAFEAAGNLSVGNVTTNSGIRPLEVGGEITQSLTVGLREIHIFTNEDVVTGLTTKLSGLSNVRDLEAIQIPYTAPLAPPFLSSSIRKSVDVKAESNETFDVRMVRTVAKVVLNLKQEWGISPVTEVVIDRVQMMGLPEYSYLIGKDYDGKTFVNSEEAADVSNHSIETNTYENTFTFYIPEFLGATVEEGKHAYIEIQGHIKDNEGIICTYRCPLGDGMAIEPMTDYNITRNTHFTVNGTITGYGQTNKLEIKATVQDWNTVNSIPEELGKYVKIKSIKAGTTDLATDPNYKFNRNGETITVELDANVVGTVLEIIDAKGAVISTQTHTDIATKSIQSTLPINFGVEGGTPVAARNYTLRITNPTTKMHYNSADAANKIEVTRSQGAIVWATKNVGANNNYESGNVFQFNRNTAFPSPQGISQLPNSHDGRITSAESESVTYKDTYIYIGTSTVVLDRFWSTDDGGDMWQNDAKPNPCKSANSAYRIPSKTDFDGILSIASADISTVSGISGRSYGTVVAGTIFIPIRGYREWHSKGTASGQNIHGILWSCTKTDVKTSAFVLYVESKSSGYFGSACGFPLRCVQYID